MPRINIYLDDATMATLKKIAEEKKLKPSQCVALLIKNSATHKYENAEDFLETVEALRRAENANGKNISAIVEMLNTFFKQVASDDDACATFYPSDETPHPWLRKAYEVVEARLRVAIYNKQIKRDHNG
jgi:hypothetical protein